jgi:glyceraldehyde 3-phosphate dehydrogenase
MGKLALRALVEDGVPGEIVLLNDAVGDPAMHAHLLEFDSVHGRWPASFAHDAEAISVDGRRMRLTAARRIEDLPLAETGVDVVVDCTGAFKTAARLKPYFEAGVA